MSAKTATKSSKSLEIEFINWELTKEEKEAAKSFPMTAQTVFSALERLIDDGYRVSFKRDYYNKCFNVSLTEPERAGIKVCRCIVSRGPSVIDAARVAAFKHFELLQGDWGGLSSATLDRDVWA